MGTLILRDSHRSLEKKMEDLDRLKDETAKRIKEAADQGDLKENAEYHAAREEQSLIIRKMQTLQSYSPFQIIEEGEIETDTVGFGNKVTILEEGKEEAEDYYLLGPIESEMDLFPLVVTVHSPFGQSIIGLEVGDDFTLDIRGVDTRFTITAIDKVSSEK
jgi:transcription elongation factor GreA|tara:strand:+ start:158 stop:640 length:483 start_codon:yes stop_codon:yes gene_type:complete